MLRFLCFLVITILISGCTKCVECEIKLKESQDIIGYVDEFCGTDKKVEAEEDRLRSDYTCIECIVHHPAFGPTPTGIYCGDRSITDSVHSASNESALNLGTTADC
ncbi:MAG: hypothetical protein QF371_06015, partial [Flavobacteriales bacterium]|nr:hypothetical protein [Flavobacteriales bacterium]